MIISGSILVAANGIILFFSWLSSYSTVYMHYTFFTHSLVNGHSSCFYILAIVNSVSVNLGLRVYLGRFFLKIFIYYLFGCIES